MSTLFTLVALTAANAGTATAAEAKTPPPVFGNVKASAVKSTQTVTSGSGHVHKVTTFKDSEGWKLQVDGKDFMVFGMNWIYMPIGENYSYDFWGKPDEFIKEALRREMSLLREMGVNSVRLYTGVPQRWITYMYEEYGVWTILNHAMGRYGHNIDGAWVAPTNYADPRTREVLTEEIKQIAREYKDTRGLLMWLLGNENNYGLYWSSAEIEDLPDMNQQDARATFLYTLYGEITDAIHEIDDLHPVAIANGDLQFIDLIAEHAPNIDIMGSNVYRGKSSGDIFARVDELLDKPFVYTEFGSDAYNAKDLREDQLNQAIYDADLWQEIYEQSHGKGRVGNAIGGMTFQWSDGWWKYRQTENLDVHDNTASWGNGAYKFDYVEGQNNMNEEWFGIVAKGPTDAEGHYEVYPRAAFYVLKEGCALDPYAASTTLDRIREHWSRIDPRDYTTKYDVQALRQEVEALGIVQSVNLISQLETFATGGERLSIPERDAERFDSLQSFYLDFAVRPTNNIRANVSVNVLGNVPTNPINEFYYENRGLNQVFIDADGEEAALEGIERIAVYQATMEWDEEYFNLKGFYRSGHYHWGYEGDFFGIYQEANYQPGVDAFNANTPSGFEIEGKKAFDGIKIAAGPELTWGSNPTIIAKYQKQFGNTEVAVMHQEDIAQAANAPTSSVIPLPRTRKTSLYLGYRFGNFKFEVGGLMAGTDRLDRQYTIVRDAEGDGGYLNSGFDVLDDRIELLDTLGAKAKITYQKNNINLYLQGGYRGLVADGGGGDNTITFTGWTLRDSGKGNNYNVLAGGAFNFGDFQIAPNFMYQKPLEGPLPIIEDLFDRQTGQYFAGVNPRSLLSDPFWVDGNRETIGLELLVSFDPTGATWMWAWDNAVKEDAPFAAFVDFTYRVLPTSQDSRVAVAAEGFLFAFPNAPAARDLYEVRGRIIMNPDEYTHLVVDGYGGIGQANGDDERVITRGGANFRLTHKKLNLAGFVKINDWGPFDLYRDFNLTFPLQTMLDVSYSATTPKWFVQAQTRMGVAGQFRLLDEFSDRYLADPTDPNAIGNEWEIRTYVHITL